MIDSNLYVRPELCKDQVRYQVDVLHTILFPTFYFRLFRYTHHYADEPTFMESWTISEARLKYGNGGYKDKRLFVCIHLHPFSHSKMICEDKKGKCKFLARGRDNKKRIYNYWVRDDWDRRCIFFATPARTHARTYARTWKHACTHPPPPTPPRARAHTHTHNSVLHYSAIYMWNIQLHFLKHWVTHPFTGDWKTSVSSRYDLHG